jgi:putative spermidine/putrescine transport system ATP-binding protein
MTTVYVTHDQREAITMSDRIAVMNVGRIVQLDTPQQLYVRPRTRFVADFVGESSLLPVEVDEAGARFGGRLLKSYERPSNTVAKQWLVIRPEKLLIVEGAVDTASLNVFDGTVAELIYQGESFLCYVRLCDGSALAIRDYSRGQLLAKIPPVGQPIRLGLSPEDTTVVYEDQ